MIFYQDRIQELKQECFLHRDWMVVSSGTFNSAIILKVLINCIL